MRIALIVTATICVLFGCKAQIESGPSAALQSSTLGFDFANWPSVTENPISVPSAFLVFCAPPTEAQLETDRKVHGPHSQSEIVVRVNAIGIEQFKTGRSAPAGTIVVKEKYTRYSPNTPPSAIGAMIKREPGYDPEHGDWEYAYEEQSPKTERTLVRGRLDSCIKCHSGARDTDYLFRGYLQASR